jgi:hypothetical protein
MNTEATRLKIIHWVAQIDDENLLNKIESLIESSNWNKLSYSDRQAIEEGLSQLNEGASVSYTDVRKEIETLLSRNK